MKKLTALQGPDKNNVRLFPTIDTCKAVTTSIGLAPSCTPKNYYSQADSKLLTGLLKYKGQE